MVCSVLLSLDPSIKLRGRSLQEPHCTRLPESCIEQLPRKSMRAGLSDVRRSHRKIKTTEDTRISNCLATAQTTGRCVITLGQCLSQAKHTNSTTTHHPSKGDGVLGPKGCSHSIPLESSDSTPSLDSVFGLQHVAFTRSVRSNHSVVDCSRQQPTRRPRRQQTALLFQRLCKNWSGC